MKRPPSARSSARNTALIAVFCALCCVCAQIVIPIGTVPITLLTLAAYCAYGVLGGVRGTVAVAIYVAMGALGLPVYAGFAAGVGHLLGPTGGYLVGLVSAGLLYALLTQGEFSAVRHLVALVLATLLCYAVGTVWLVWVARTAPSVGVALATGVLPFLLPDAAKLALSHLITLAVRKHGLRH